MTRFDFSKLAVPLIQAPMAGGANTPQLVAAVANAGAMGSFGFAYSTPDRIAKDLKAARSLTDGPINANFFLFPTHLDQPAEPEQAAALAALREAACPEYADVASALATPGDGGAPDLGAMLDAVWASLDAGDGPDVLTFHFGAPDEAVVRAAHARGVAVGASATSVAEAEAVAAAGADFVVAQGAEAGGHRGTFHPGDDTEEKEKEEDEGLPCLKLVRRITRAFAGTDRGAPAGTGAAAPVLVPVQVVAAGGIMDGADIHAAVAAGAAAAQCGTAFLTTDESGASAAHKRLLLSADGWARGTESTRAFSGRAARGITNAFIERMRGRPTLPFPLQNTATGPLRACAGEHDDGEFQSLWAGAEYARARAMSAADLVGRMHAEYEGACAAVAEEQKERVVPVPA